MLVKKSVQRKAPTEPRIKSHRRKQKLLKQKQPITYSGVAEVVWIRTRQKPTSLLFPSKSSSSQYGILLRDGSKEATSVNNIGRSSGCKSKANIWYLGRGWIQFHIQRANAGAAQSWSGEIPIFNAKCSTENGKFCEDTKKKTNFTTHSSCGRSHHATPPCMEKPTQSTKKLWAQYGTKFYGLLFCIASYSHSLTRSRQGQENKREILTGGSFSSVSR